MLRLKILPQGWLCHQNESYAGCCIRAPVTRAKKKLNSACNDLSWAECGVRGGQPVRTVRLCGTHFACRFSRWLAQNSKVFHRARLFAFLMLNVSFCAFLNLNGLIE
jgi:hypothetical protein